MLTIRDVNNAIVKKYMEKSIEPDYIDSPVKQQELLQDIVGTAIEAVENYGNQGR